MIDLEFKKKITALIEVYVKEAAKQPFDKIVENEKRVSKNKAEFVLGYEIGALEGEIANLFILTFNRRMNPEEIIELREMSNDAFLLLKKLTGFGTIR